jgi:outer membrane receptor for ferric coprogen and ferric-rhodotorulic acid
VNGEYVRPADGVDIEVGIKGAWRDGALNGILALYDINQHGLASNDTDAPLSARLADTRCCYKPGGYNRSKGVDTELSGEVMPGWLIGTGYTYNINRAGRGPELSSATPRHLFKLWTSTELPGVANRFTVGGSVHAQSSNFVAGVHCPQRNAVGSCIPGHIEPFRSEQGFFVVVDLRAGYDIGSRWRAALSLNNVFDRVYYETIGTPNGSNWYGEPRNVALRVEGHY